MGSSTDNSSQSKRPALMARQSSTSSQVSQSPPNDTHHKAHKRQHVVGQSRMQRNTSLGKNLNKLSKLAQAQQAQAADASKHHRRSLSGNSDSKSAPSSPRPSFKRNASSGGVVRAANHAHTHSANLRKNHSSGHLPRQGSSKNTLKSSRSEKALSQAGKQRRQSPETHPTVHFDVGNEDDADNAWTEESASQSPTTTRSNTRQNSVILDPHKAMDTAGQKNKQEEPLQTEANGSRTSQPQVSAQHHPERPQHSRPSNGSSSHHQSHHHSRPPDADMITSRLLQRNSSHNPTPQLSSIAATVMSDAHDARVLSHSAGSTLVDTPGRDLVSRFMDGDGSAGTPNDGSYLPSRASPQPGGEFDKAKRNKSMPNVADTASPSRAQSRQSRRSGTTTPTDLPLSRTQQKMMLQRASSNIEPQKLVPVVLPRTGGPPFLQGGMPYTAHGEGRLDPRLQQQFNHVAVEYKVVRRYRNPLADAVVRLQQIPGPLRKARNSKSAHTNGYASAHGGGSLSTSFSESGVETDGTVTRRSRVSFESAHGDHSDEGYVMGSEAEGICRRLWESAEVVEGD